MFTVTVPDLVIRQSIEVCRQTNFGMRGNNSDGTKDQQLQGIIAQNSMALALGFPFVTVSDCWDGGYDFKIGDQKVDIKNISSKYTPKLHYEAKVVTEQLRYDVQVYLFTSLNTTNAELTVCGWLPKNQFLEKARIFKRGDVVDRGDGTQFVCRLNSHQVYIYQLNHSASNFEELQDELDLFYLLG